MTLSRRQLLGTFGLSLATGCKRTPASDAHAPTAAPQPAARAPVTVTDATGQPVTIADASRIISAGGAITETLYALGVTSQLVATDASSTFPEAATHLPQVGYHRALSAEGILSQRPTLLITTTEAGPPPVLAQLRAANVTVLTVDAAHGVEPARARIRAVAQAVGKVAEGDALIATLNRELQAANIPTGLRPKVVFIYARGGGTVNVAGAHTAADAMIALAGGTNAITGFDNYRPLTAESMVAAAPDVIVMTTRGLQGVGGVPGVLSQPGVSLTPAGRNAKIVSMDDLLLLGFGPRTGQAVTELARLIHPA